MDWKDLAQTVGKVAPVLGSVLGGPVGAVAGAAGGLISALFGDDVEATPEAVAAAIKADPEAMIKIKELEIRQEGNLLKWREQQLAAAVDDRKSARKRQVDVTKATGQTDNHLYGLAWINVLGFFGVMGAVIYFAPKIPDTGMAATAIPMLLGGLIVSYKDVIGYFFGGQSMADDKAKMRNGK